MKKMMGLLLGFLVLGGFLFLDQVWAGVQGKEENEGWKPIPMKTGFVATRVGAKQLEKERQKRIKKLISEEVIKHAFNARIIFAFQNNFSLPEWVYKILPQEVRSNLFLMNIGGISLNIQDTPKETGKKIRKILEGNQLFSKKDFEEFKKKENQFFKNKYNKLFDENRNLFIQYKYIKLFESKKGFFKKKFRSILDQPSFKLIRLLNQMPFDQNADPLKRAKTLSALAMKLTGHKKLGFTKLERNQMAGALYYKASQNVLSVSHLIPKESLSDLYISAGQLHRWAAFRSADPKKKMMYLLGALTLLKESRRHLKSAENKIALGSKIQRETYSAYKHALFISKTKMPL